MSRAVSGGFGHVRSHTSTTECSSVRMTWLNVKSPCLPRTGVSAHMAISFNSIHFNDQFILENQLYSKGLRQQGLEPANAVGVVFKLNAACGCLANGLFRCFSCKQRELGKVFGLLWSLRKFERRFTIGLKTGDKALVNLGSSEIVKVALEGRCFKLEGLGESIAKVGWERPLQE